MFKIRNLLLLGLFTSSLAVAELQMSVGIGLPNVSIGINVPAYPEFALVPGYPVYYAPRMEANFFFYDGLYWVYQDDNWYESSWYNGPWWLVDPDEVPLYVLRIPVRYYRTPPAYFLGWQIDSPPRWGDHWGRDWDKRRSGWDSWNRGSVAAAPLPTYQRQYSGNRYPNQIEQQRAIHQQNYHFQPHDSKVRKQYQEQATSRTLPQQDQSQLDRQKTPEVRNPKQQGNQRPLTSKPDSQQPTMPPRQSNLDNQRDQLPRSEIVNGQKPVSIPSKQSQPEVRNEIPQSQQRIDQNSLPSTNGNRNRPTPAVTQDNRSDARVPMQQQGKEAVQHDQKNTRQPIQKENQQRNDTLNEPKQGQRQDLNKGRND